MKKRISKGFTITEMMLAMSVMGIILLITITFFQHQSQMSGTSTRERSGRQSIALALTALQQDIQQAGYGLAKYPQLAFMLGDNWNVNSTHRNLNPQDPKFNQPVYGTIWVNYGQYLKSSIPIDPLSAAVPKKQYAMWPSLVYNQDPLSNNDMIGGSFSIPAADNPNNYYGTNDSRNILPEATANANNIGAVIVWPWANQSTPGPDIGRSVTPVNVPGAVGRSDVAGTTNSTPPSRMFTQFTVQNLPGGIFRFAPAIVYNFVPGNLSATPLTPGVITRNRAPNQSQNTFLGDSSLFVWDFQIRAMYSSADGTVQAWLPDVALPAGFNSSNLRYIEAKIVYTILDPYSSPHERDDQIRAGKISSVTKTIRVSPRTVVISTY
jgi:prepilin-type N-terminal cleavage/methylation domain-containing protein